MSSLAYRKCVVCGRRRFSGLNVFLAALPLDPARCRLWVQAIGQEDLVHLPIEKLHNLKFVCNIHFAPEDFNKQGNRLLKHAVPSRYLGFPPLPDKLLIEFPLHIGQQAVHGGTSAAISTIDAAHIDHSYSIQYTEKSATEKTSEHAKIDLSIDFSTADNTKLTADDLIVAANVVENETATSYLNKDILLDTRNTAFGTNDAPNTAAEASRVDQDGISDNDFDDFLQPTVPEPEQVPKAIFSWQKETDILPTEIMDDGVCIMGETVDLLGPADCSMYCDDEPKTDESRAQTIKSLELPAEYQCNECRKEIVGFRYTCVQCADWDLCGACEARTAHATHYVLRVPSPRPYNEVQAVLTAIRQQLLSENLFLNQEIIHDSLKVEVKEEPGEAPAAPEPAPEPDPLEDPHSDYHGDATQTEDSSEESDVSSSPRLELRSLRTLRSDNTDENTATVKQHVLTVQDDATIPDHIDLTETVSDATRISTADKPTRIIKTDRSKMIITIDKRPTRIITSNKPATIISLGTATNKLAPVDPNTILTTQKSKIVTVNPAQHSTPTLIKSLAKNSPTACANITKVLAYNKARIEQSKKPTNLSADKNLTRIPTSDPTKLPYPTPKLISTSNPKRRVVTLEYLTKRGSDDTQNVAEPVPTHRTMQTDDDTTSIEQLERTMQTDDVICLDDTNTTAIEQLAADRLESETVSNVTLQARDRVEGCSEPSAARGPEGEVILRVPSDTNEVDLARALHSKVTVRLQPLQVADYPAKIKRLKLK